MKLMTNTNEIDYSWVRDAKDLYVDGKSEYIGRLVMSQMDASSLPIPLENVYKPAINSLKDNSDKAENFARSFGELSVNVALNNQETSFSLVSEKQYPPGDIAQIATARKFNIHQLFSAPEVDSAYIYLLSTDIDMKPELALIQTLHLLDYAIITKQFDGNMPIVRGISLEELRKLQTDNPSVFLRTYGNVRHLADVPFVLGTVIPINIVERSKLSLTKLFGKSSDMTSPSPDIEQYREPATTIGITTAKQPHIGHGFLLTKAIAEAGKNA